MRRARFRTIVLATLVLFVVLFTATWLGLHKLETNNRAKPATLGVSFSDKYARELGLDPHQTFLALLGDLKIKHLRLMSYWDEVEPSQDHFDYKELDWQLAQAAKYHATVTLAIGLRQPRYPECHYPGWATNLSYDSQLKALYTYLAQTVNRYKDNHTITSWQLENEALNRVFGQCHDFNYDRLQAEYQLVKQIDTGRPVITNLSNEWGLPLRAPLGDQIGFSMYRVAYIKPVWHAYFYYWAPAWGHTLRARVIQRLWHKPIMIHELQAEPWGPAPTGQLSLAEQNKSMNAAKIQAAVNYAKSTGLSPIYLWGGEWWYWRYTKFHDVKLWQTVQQIYKTSS